MSAASYATSAPAWWAPIYLEPMPGSGERFTVAVVAVVDGQHRILQTITPAVARCMYGERGANVLGMVRLATESLGAHLGAGNPLAGWKPPLPDALQIGAPHDTDAETSQEAIEDALALSSSLGWRVLKPELAEIAGEDEPDRWESDVRNALVAVKPSLKTAFNVKNHIRLGAAPTRIAFMGQRLAANFVKLRTDNAAFSRHYAKSKILDLQLVRDHQGIVGRSRYELLVWRRSKADKAVQQIFLELEGYCDDHELIIRPMANTKDAVRHILEVEQS